MVLLCPATARRDNRCPLYRVRNFSDTNHIGGLEQRWGIVEDVQAIQNTKRTGSKGAPVVEKLRYDPLWGGWEGSTWTLRLIFVSVSTLWAVWDTLMTCGGVVGVLVGVGEHILSLVPNPSVGLGTVGKFWLTRGVSEALNHLGLGTARTFKKIIDITFTTVDIYLW